MIIVYPFFRATGPILAPSETLQTYSNPQMSVNPETIRMSFLFTNPPGFRQSTLTKKLSPLFRWVARGREKKVAAFRLKTIELMDPEKLKSGIEVYIDRPYDYRYAPEDNEIYCSELVWNVFNEQFEIQLGHWQKLGDLDYRDHELFIRKMEGGNLPLERPMITPVGITTSKQLKAVFPASR